MSEGTKRRNAQSAATPQQGVQYAFLPTTPLPSNLPFGPVAIAEMADAFGVTHRTLHFYEEKGLIRAGRIGLMRVYGHDDVLQMGVINACREVGMPVVVIQELMEELQHARSQDEAERIFREALMIRKRELIAGMSTVRRQMQQISTLLDQDSAMPLSTNDNQDDIDLSGIERQCLDMMADGHTAMRMARALDLAPDHVQELEMAILRKFSANNRFQAVAKAVLLGLVQS